MAATKNRALYQFKVTLRGLSPPIWRRFQVWEDATLAQLHRILQSVMGWEDYHLYEFRIGSKRYGVPNPEDQPKVIDTKRTRIRAIVLRVGTEFEYVYDFGDYWQHDLLLEAILQPSQDATYPRCIGGERSCPPEDVGGPGGYERYLEALADPQHEEHQDMMRWRGPFDPETFSVEKVNRHLERKLRPLRKKAIALPPRQASTAKNSRAGAAALLEALLAVPSAPEKDRIRVKPNETVPLELNERERELILSHTFADESLTNRLPAVPKKDERSVFRFTLDDLDELAGFVAFEANHTKNKKLQKELELLLDRIQATLDRYTDQDD